MRFGALEHQMFEKMRDAGFAWRIVGRAIAIPDHMCHDRRAVIFDDDDFQAIAELCLRNRRAGWFALHLRRGVQIDALPRRKKFTKSHSIHRFLGHDPARSCDKTK